MKLVYWVLLAGLILIFGSNYTTAKFALRYSTPLVFSFLRTALGFALTLPYAVYTIRKLKANNAEPKRNYSLRTDGKTIFYIIFFGMTSSTFFFGFWYAGEALTSASISSVIVNMSPLFTVIFAYFFLRDKVTRMQIAALVLGFFGALLVASNGSFVNLYGDWLGFILLFLSSASFAASLIIYKRFLAGFEPVTLNMLQLFFAAIGLFIWILISDPRSLLLVDFNTTFLVTLLYTTVFGSVIANLIFMALIRQKGPTWFSMWLFLSPVAGVAISSLVIGESLLPIQIVGMLLVISSIYEINKVIARVPSKIIQPTSPE